ncbi:MAG: hypothetical protein EF813_05940 [Methanosarcinales archaeon]|nr:MAG: hypothetical protein EF813_05940 [Methanosarcinales archaeon]
MKEHLRDHVYTTTDKKMNKLQMLLGGSCFDFVTSASLQVTGSSAAETIKRQYALIIFGDNGRRTIIKKVFGRVVIDTLGKVGDDIHTTVIFDDDGEGYGKLKKNISDKLKSILKDTSKFTNNLFPTLEENNGSLILNHPKGGGVFEVRLLTVPGSLEEQVVRKCIEVKCPNNSKILENGSHHALDSLAMNYCDGDKEKLIRATSALLKDEVWVTDIVDQITS